MATPLRIPLRQVMPNAPAPRLGAEADAMRLQGSATGGLGKAVSTVADNYRKIQDNIDEFRARRDSLALKNAQADYDIYASQESTRLQTSQGLDQVDDKGVMGFEKAGQEFSKNLGNKEVELGVGLGPQGKEAFQLWVKQRREDFNSSFSRSMLDKEVNVRESQVHDKAIELATKTGDIDKVTNYLLSPDEHTGRTPMDWVAHNKRQLLLDDVKENSIRSLVNAGQPDIAKAVLEKDQALFSDPARWNRMMDIVTAAKKKKTAFSVQQQRAGVLSVLGLIDKDGNGVEDKITSTPELSGPASAKDVQSLLKWNKNRWVDVPTNYGTALDMFSVALDAVGKSDQYDARMKIAEARYGDKQKLDMRTYGELVGMMSKAYPPHAIAGIKAAYEATASNPGNFIIGVGWGMEAPIRTDDRYEQVRNFMSWFDKKMEKGDIPDTEQCIVAAKKLGTKVSSSVTAWGETNVKRQSVIDEVQSTYASDEQRKAAEDERKKKLMEGLSDDDRTAVNALLQTMTIDEFEKRYMQ